MTRVTFTRGTDVVTPWDRIGHESSQASRNVVHQIIGTPKPSYSLEDDGPRAGTHVLLFLTAADAHAARKLFATAGVWTLTDTDVPEVNMTFIRDGDLGAVQQDARLRWVLNVGYREVLT